MDSMEIETDFKIPSFGKGRGKIEDLFQWVFGNIKVIYITIIIVSILSIKQALAINTTINPLYS